MKQFTSFKGLLALIVFLHHIELVDGAGDLAVCLFFTISGFLSAIGYHKRIFEPDWSYASYLSGKIIRFYPMHWLLTFSLIPLILCTSDSLSAQFALLPVNLSLLQSLIPISRVYFSWNAVSWYLSDTIIFVALLPLILRWLSRATTKGKIIVWTTAFSLYALLWCILPSGYTHAIFYIHPFVRLLDYAVGVQCGLLYMTLLRKEHLLKHVERNRNLYQLGGWALFTSLFCLSFVPSELSLHSVIYLFPACALLIIMAINGGGILQNTYLQWFGSISFAFYLTHQVTLRYVHFLLGKVDCDIIYISAPLAFILTTAASYYLTYHIDKNIGLWLKRNSALRSTTVR